MKKVNQIRTKLRSFAVVIGATFGLIATVRHDWFLLIPMIAIWGIVLLDLISEVSQD